MVRVLKISIYLLSLFLSGCGTGYLSPDFHPGFTAANGGGSGGGGGGSNPAPSVTSLSISAGALGGGTSTTITGTGFLSGATVSFGGSAGTSVSVVNATTITVTTPAHSAGAVNVVVTNSDSQSGTLTKRRPRLLPCLFLQELWEVGLRLRLQELDFYPEPQFLLVDPLELLFLL